MIGRGAEQVDELDIVGTVPNVADSGVEKPHRGKTWHLKC